MPRNFKRFPMKPNIGIATSLGIQMAKNHILRNLDAKSNMNSPVPNITLELEKKGDVHKSKSHCIEP